ncbi:NADH-quinone oxidoreductase subunit NuoG [Natronospira bacteriovora]|uniref:NADH-quinone oxidoreductase n=1 Tax=Natronospira bacteriovora TaxID=3069753 RepID=A0ABU0W7Z3_9GAMM|nr:NADH-quinone oxidoreductase subunit NuoG [Natronospira sp. AB-CW4]MDQ2069135.1 NADH-quinone oxidoreductase subunit NuoG [Natronospira sp. AB-CW4]
MSDDTVKFEINGQTVEGRKGQMLIEVADEYGHRIPRFCYHRKLSVAANCRMCLVEVEKAPKPLPACATPVGDGMKVFTQSPKALSAQKNTMEFLLINHPLDCPICDQGGECELQDLALGFGRGISRYTESKRVVSDPELGPLISTDMTRCIHCTRCVRFTEEVAGFKELGATGRGEHMRIGTYIQRTVDHELSGNVIDLCPVGALNNKPFRFRGRSWEMTQHATVTPHDPVGTNIYAHTLRGDFLRAVPRENEGINETWIADRDRFSCEGIYSDERLRQPLLRRDGELQPVSWEEALEAAATGLRDAVQQHGGEQLGALASPTASLEELYLFQSLVRGLGSANLDHRLGQADFRSDAIEPAFPGLGMKLSEVEDLDAALVVGSNTRKEAPMLAHRLRKAALKGAEVGFVNPADYEFLFRQHATLVRHGAELVSGLAEVAVALASESGKSLPASVKALVDGVEAGDEARKLAAALNRGGRSLVLLGPLARSHEHWSELLALGDAIAELSGAVLGYLAEGGNVAGACLAGVLPHRGPGAAEREVGLNAREMFAQARKAYLLMGCEPEREAWDSAQAMDALEQAGFVLSLSSFRTPEMERYASVVLPVGSYAESFGTLVNLEGRWQSSGGVINPVGESRPAWKVLRVLGNLLELEGFEQMDAEAVLADAHAAIGEVVTDMRVSGGVKLNKPAVSKGLWRLGEVPLYAADALVRRAEPLQRTLDGVARLRISAADAGRLGVEDDSRVEVRQNGRSCVLTAAVDDGLPEGSVVVPAGTAETAALGPRHGSIELSKV